MSPIVYNINNATLKTKMASFDYDWTIVNPLLGKIFPTNVDDWQWMYPSIPYKIKQYYEEDYMIVIFTNQSKEWKCEQILKVVKLLNIPLFVVIARDKCDYKPNIILFNTLFKTHQIDKTLSFFAGDALGRPGDFSDSDKLFAENIKIPYISPEKIFNITNDSINLPMIHLSDTPEIIIMVGYPGSGKSTIAKNLCMNDNYIHIEGDIYKTSGKMIKQSIQYILQKKSIIFDATNGSIKKRQSYIELGNTHNYHIKCIHKKSTLEEAYKQNKCRDDKKQVPRIAYSVYSKYYDEPTELEGFELYSI